MEYENNIKNEAERLVNFSEIAKSMNLCKIVAQILPLFYRKTGIIGTINFTYNKQQDGMELNLSFSREPNKEEFSNFIEEIFDSEKLLYAQTLLESLNGFDNLEQIRFKYKEDAIQILERRKNV